MSEKIQSWSLDQKKLKKRGERSNYVGENLILKSRPKKERGGKDQNISENIDLVIIR